MKKLSLIYFFRKGLNICGFADVTSVGSLLLHFFKSTLKHIFNISCRMFRRPVRWVAKHSIHLLLRWPLPHIFQPIVARQAKHLPTTVSCTRQW